MSLEYRRDFLKKFSLGLSSLVAATLFSYTSKSSKSIIMQTIKSIKPLGFQWETSDPFLFCVHHEDDFPEGNEKMGPSTSLDGRRLGEDFIIKDGFRMYHGKTVPGFPGHPHRGFETITVVRKGLVDHSDSMGAAGRYGNGDVQWMTAGKGVQHAEMFPLLEQTKKNPLELFQIWLNLPKKNKMVDPHFKMLWKEDIPILKESSTNGSISIEVIAGKLKNIAPQNPPPNSWAADEDNEVGVWNITMEPNTSFTLPKSQNSINRTLYFYEGSHLIINNQSIPNYHAVEVESTEDLILQSSNEPIKLLVLQGKPIGEPVIQYGPFVMNTKAEINQAFEDYHATQFGGWPWGKYDHVHPRNKSRFAKHANGIEEIKNS